MKKLSQFNESCVTADINPGNAFINTGVTNHLTPVNNIVTSVRNLFGVMLSVVASVGEDNVSVKLNSSYFTSKDEVSKILYRPVYQNTSLYTFIAQQGLDLVKMIDLGHFWVVYFCPRDIVQAENPELNNSDYGCTCGDCPCDGCDCACEEMKECLIDEAEMQTITESDDDEEMEDLNKKKISELIKSKDKVKAAKQFELLVSQEMELPREYYFAGVKDKDGEESIALRWKYTKVRPHNKSSESTRSLVNIFDDSKEGVWVQDFAKDSMFKLPDEVKKLIENFLEFLGAKKTNNPAVYSLAEGDDDKKDDDKDDEKDDDKSDDTSSDSSSDSKSDSNDDKEDDKSRGDSEDDLL